MRRKTKSIVEETRRPIAFKDHTTANRAPASPNRHLPRRRCHRFLYNCKVVRIGREGRIDVSRILIHLAGINLAALLATFVVGVLSWLRGGIHDDSVVSYELHLYLALFSLIFNLGLHCLVFIYFLGTGRWVKEVALAYQLPDEPLPKTTRELKRKTFPPALFAMLVPIAAAAAGMANIHQHVAWAANLHLGMALCTLLVNVWALRIEYRNVTTNATVIDRVMQEVERIRAEKGLPSSAEAWEQADPA